MRILICDDDSSITQSLSQIIKVYFKKKKVNVITFKLFCASNKKTIHFEYSDEKKES